MFFLDELYLNLNLSEMQKIYSDGQTKPGIEMHRRIQLLWRKREMIDKNLGASISWKGFSGWPMKVTSEQRNGRLYREKDEGCRGSDSLLVKHMNMDSEKT